MIVDKFLMTSIYFCRFLAESLHIKDQKNTIFIIALVCMYIYGPSYAAQRHSERNESTDHEIIRNLSVILAQYNPFTRIYRHTYEILSNHESTSINSEDRSSNNGPTESGLSNSLPNLRLSSSLPLIQNVNAS